MNQERMKYCDETVDAAWNENEAFDKAKKMEQDYMLNERIAMTIGGENKSAHLRLADTALQQSAEAWDEVTPSVANRHRITHKVQ